MASTNTLTDFNIVKMPQAVRDAIGNQGANKLHIVTKDDSDTNLEVYSTQRIDEITADATQTTAGLMTAADKKKLDGIAEGSNKYTLPTATTSALGGIKSGGDITVGGDGTVTVNDDSHNHVIDNVDGLQNALDAKVAGPASSTANHIAVFDGATGKLVKDSGHTIQTSVPADAVFTDTTYTAATQSAEGLMSAADKKKLDGIAEGANKYTLPTASSSTLGGIKIGTGLSIASGVASVATATSANIGGIKSGGDITVGGDGTVTVNDDSHNHVIDNVDGLQNALDAKAPLASPALTGTPTAPTATAGTKTTQIATTAFVDTAINNVLSASNAMTFEGTIGTSGTISSLPASHTQGDTYVVTTAGTYAGQVCEVGDMIVCNTSGTTANDAHWTVVQTNINGAITGADTSTLTKSNTVAIFNGTDNRVIKSSGYTIAKSVPADAVFTDTVYTHPTHAAAASGFYKVTVNNLGHVTATSAVTKDDLTALGVSGVTITTYTTADMT